MIKILVERFKIIELDRYISKTDFGTIKYKKALKGNNQIYNYKRYIFNIRYKIIKESNIYRRYKRYDKNLKE